MKYVVLGASAAGVNAVRDFCVSEGGLLRLLFRRRGRLNSRGVALRERALRGRAHSLRVEYFRRKRGFRRKWIRIYSRLRARTLRGSGSFPHL